MKIDLIQFLILAKFRLFFIFLFKLAIQSQIVVPFKSGQMVSSIKSGQMVLSFKSEQIAVSTKSGQIAVSTKSGQIVVSIKSLWCALYLNPCRR